LVGAGWVEFEFELAEQFPGGGQEVSFDMEDSRGPIVPELWFR
jgi:hypothetical protein